MVNHGLVSAALFFIIAALAERAGGSEDLRVMGGIAKRAPMFATVFLIVTLATLAMPGSPNFIGELMILLGTFEAHLVFAVIASLGVVGAAFYSLRIYVGAMHNRTGAAVQSHELTRAEAAPLLCVVAVIVALSLSPQFLLDRSQASVTRLVTARGGLAAATR
jgi:NADH-quinone oxidoreductase subunit M